MMIFGVRILKPHSFLPGRIPEAAKPQFAMGPQKCVVMGPVGELINAASARRQRLVAGEAKTTCCNRVKWTK